MITVQNLSHQIGRTGILHDINLQIAKGNITALIGPNGAGKSTLLSLIARLMPHQTGTITVDDLQVGHCDTNTLAKHLSILPQTPQIAPRLTVADLVAFGRYPHHKGRPTEEDTAMVAQTLTLFDLHALQYRPLDSLSGGQRQRALLAMIFAQDTAYMLLDEPLNNLDIAASRSLMKLLKTLTKDHGRTIVIVLHDINYACAYADHIVTMKDGHIGPSGPPDTLITDEMIAEIFGTDAPVLRADGHRFVAV